MKRNLTFAWLLTLIIIVGSGCGKDLPANTSIIGTWEAISIREVVADSSIVPSSSITDSSFTPGHSLTVQFKSDSTFISVDHSPSSSGGGTGKYYVSGDSLFEFDSGASGYVYDGNYTVVNNSLKLIIGTYFPGYSDIIIVSFVRQPTL
jgi:hypothetical protein